MAIPRVQELNQKITFYDTSPPVAINGIAAEDVTICTAWARITELGGGMAEPVTFQNEKFVREFELWIRYNSLVTAFLQIAWGSRTLVIMSVPQLVIDTNNRRWMVFRAQETIERTL